MAKNAVAERKSKVIEALLAKNKIKYRKKHFEDVVRLSVGSYDVYIRSEGWTNMVVAQDDITLFKSSDVEAIFRFLFDKAKLELATKTLSSLGYSKREIEKLLGGN
jgi:hypothetical protein